MVINVNDRKDNKIETFPYKGKPLEVKDVWIRWLSQVGPEGAPEYGLRFFTIGKGGLIPIHNHFYQQTMYILSGHVLVTSYSIEKDEKVEEKAMGPNDIVFVPSREPHSIRNLSDAEEVTFLCCIANIYEDESV